MPFQNDPAIRPLMDIVDGGPPKAWYCLLAGDIRDRCGKITKTLDGMRKHQEQVHGYTPQAEIGDKPVTVASGDPASIIGHHEVKTTT